MEVSIALAVGGWLFSTHKDREQEKFKARLSRREELCTSYIRVNTILRMTQGQVDKEPKFTEEWLRLAALMKLYATKEELEKFEDFATAYFEKKNIDGSNETFNSLEQTIVGSVRKDLGFGLPRNPAEIAV